jgi:hypothetical protein
LGDALFKEFGPGTVYEDARTQSNKPVQGPWTNHCLKIMIANRENGEVPGAEKNTKDPDGFCKTVALGGLNGSTPLDSVKECVRTVQV